ncbi:hypothetical protein WISP_72944 [Willisornis vidua]|uniref:Uncharacterized protein n=1 Tax=Willisornis vidua TaxID=1566151 RepID=A0ABQ9D7D7_9PASS|nr:hypothetical protein WISP_72944 [Willisornis vidua]
MGQNQVIRVTPRPCGVPESQNILGWKPSTEPTVLLLFQAEASVGEQGREKRALQVTVTNPVQCSLHGRKCTVSVETKINQSQPDFTKHRSGFVLCVPGN